MKKLIEGILDFRRKLLVDYREKYAHLALGQYPDTLFIACSDSRVVPNLFASTNPGDLFVIRNVGNLVPPIEPATRDGFAEAAAIEFALTNLPISEIVVCGHSECAAMKVVLEGEGKVQSANLKTWLKNCDVLLGLEKGALVTPPNLAPQNVLSQLNVLHQIKHLKTYPLVQEKLKNSQLNIHGWYFDIATGDVYSYEEQFNQFVLMDEKEAERVLKRLKTS
ncbi:MAG TPA: carbonic anhydrase [Rhabdochlamydiaceae bacterium]|nr:carbonic anhydrase [Rhabdochlamydiaceae bacterium]